MASWLTGLIATQPAGEVFCYADGEKPPVGQGLNCDAEITLVGVYKTDKETGQPVRDGPSLVKWEKSLRTMCARMGARFVSYKADGGVRKLEVSPVCVCVCVCVCLHYLFGAGCWCARGRGGRAGAGVLHGAARGREGCRCALSVCDEGGRGRGEGREEGSGGETAKAPRPCAPIAARPCAQSPCSDPGAPELLPSHTLRTNSREIPAYKPTDRTPSRPHTGSASKVMLCGTFEWVVQKGPRLTVPPPRPPCLHRVERRGGLRQRAIRRVVTSLSKPPSGLAAAAAWGQWGVASSSRV